jgi:hypothetical protein
MKFETFTMERWQSTWEHHVEINLSDSGAAPMTLEELLEGNGADELLAQRLMYTQTNGTAALRDRIASLYENVTRENLEVTNGGAEANLLAAWTLVEPGDEVVLQLPNYMQLWGVLHAMGANIKPWRLQPDLDAGCWDPVIDELEELVNPGTKLIAICNPNNPTGATLDADELDRIASIASSSGAWTLVDEIYQGAELEGPATPSMWGRHEKVIVTNSLSKAYGLPGLRIGWILGPEKTVEECWARHDYTTIALGALNDFLAQRALEPGRRERILQRTRTLLTGNLKIAMDWVDQHDRLRTIRPRGGAFLMLSYEDEINSTELAERLRAEKSLLLVPGDHFGMDGWVRVGFGEDTDMLKRGLDRLDEFLHELDLAGTTKVDAEQA